MLAAVSDKHLGLVGPVGAVMTNVFFKTQRVDPFAQGDVAKRESLSRRVSSSAQQLMHAWSMSSVRATTTERTNPRVADDCPPEVYLG